MNKVGAIILAAGKGSRMKSKKFNKVTLPLGDKPMILHGVNLLHKLHIDKIIVVIGFAKRSVTELFKDEVIFAHQSKRLGTAHAVYTAMKVLPEGVEEVLIIQGDDSAFYKKNTVEELIRLHLKTKSAVTFLTINVANPTGLGRVIRDSKGELKAIVEEKSASPRQRKIKEINPACYVMNVNFLKKYLKTVKKNPLKGEYYLTDLIEIALKSKEKISTLNGGLIPWRGVNTGEELKEAEELFHKMHSASAPSALDLI